MSRNVGKEVKCAGNAKGYHTSSACTLTPLIGGVRVGAMNVVWKMNAKIAQSQGNTDHKSPLRATLDCVL
jgi:hypothetical protein